VSELATGLFDVHSHLLPGVDDGCDTLTESIRCARELVRAGYTHSFCTPHFWPSLPGNTVESVKQRVADLQREFDAASVPLTLYPGGEMNLRPDFVDTPPEQIATFNMAGNYAMFDLWAERIPQYFEPSVRWLQSQGMTVVLAHPERMRAVQLEPDLADYFAELGLLLQGNLQCLGDPPRTATRQVAERYLIENRYFMLGMDLHNHSGLPLRFAGLKHAVEIAGQAAVDRLTITNPRRLLEFPASTTRVGFT
jgi:protein-tyrosine phosphatase